MSQYQQDYTYIR